MIQVGDYVVKNNVGVCHVEEIVEMSSTGAKSVKEYFLLIPEDNKSSKIYISVDSDDHRVRKLMSEQEAVALLERIPTITAADIVDNKTREMAYKQILEEGDVEKVVSLMKMIYYKKKKREEEKKYMTAMDERYYKMAENSLASELAFVIGKSKSEMSQLIRSHMMEEKA